MGATPEKLLKANGNVFETMALAGTQKDNNEKKLSGKEKEKDEQQFVTDFIVKRLREFTASVVVSEPYSLKAGSIWHIKTDISGVLKIIQLWKKLSIPCIQLQQSAGFQRKKQRFLF